MPETLARLAKPRQTAVESFGPLFLPTQQNLFAIGRNDRHDNHWVRARVVEVGQDSGARTYAFAVVGERSVLAIA